MDPTAFRDQYRTATSAVATIVDASPFGDSWSVQVLDGKAKPLGTPALVRFVGPFLGSGSDVVGASLLDREVLAQSWRANPDGTYSASATSQRA